jgi:hypothetical protein
VNANAYAWWWRSRKRRRRGRNRRQKQWRRRRRRRRKRRMRGRRFDVGRVRVLGFNNHPALATPVVRYAGSTSDRMAYLVGAVG